MYLEFTKANVYVSSNLKKIGDKKEEKMVELATEMLINHVWLGLEDTKCGCDDDYEFYTQLLYDVSETSRKEIREEFKIIKKEISRMAA